jgi:hypothetical protein
MNPLKLFYSYSFVKKFKNVLLPVTSTQVQCLQAKLELTQEDTTTILRMVLLITTLLIMPILVYLKLVTILIKAMLITSINATLHLCLYLLL